MKTARLPCGPFVTQVILLFPQRPPLHIRDHDPAPPFPSGDAATTVPPLRRDRGGVSAAGQPAGEVPGRFARESLRKVDRTARAAAPKAPRDARTKVEIEQGPVGRRVGPNGTLRSNNNDLPRPRQAGFDFAPLRRALRNAQPGQRLPTVPVHHANL